MDRRTFNKLAGLATMGALTADVDLSAAQAAAVAGEVVIEDSELLVAFNRASGVLTRMEYKPTHWTIERRPALGASFRLLAPLPERRDNFVLGQKQKAVDVKKISDHEVELRWENLVSEHGGVLPMTLKAVVSLMNGKLTFYAVLENHSHLTVETIDYPYFGDFNAGIQLPGQQQRNPIGSAFYRWDGSHGAGEGYLPEDWDGVEALFTGHYGIGFNEHGYYLEPWSPLKGKTIRLDLPYMGKLVPNVNRSQP